ncbi:VWA domain-containing protein [Rhizobium sp. P32RR-XVIII]|nr:VWA domain-containing protein [Rhizobium sp. P32RR-XVIII]
MSALSSLLASGRHILRDRSGNFAMMTAILMPVLIGAAGLAVDITNAALSQQQLQEASDAAALATASALADGKITTANAQDFAKDFLAGEMANFLDSTAAAAMKDGITVNAQQTTSGKSTLYNVSVSSTYALQLSGLASVLGYKTTNVGASSSAQGGSGPDQNAHNALSMILALDESGSMAYNTDTVASQKCIKYNSSGTKCKEYDTTYVKKIAALKTAAGALFDALDNADPTGDLVRTGAVSYTHVVKGQTSPTMAWGTTAARKYVNDMPANPQGGTDATGAMTIADTAVKKAPDGGDAEAAAQAAKNNTNVERYIVLMSDGEMTGNSNQWNSALDQTVRQKCATAKTDGITIFTVAFMAPDKGKSLLQYCASSPANYYEPNTMEGLVKDFESIAQAATKTTTRLTN